MIKTLSFVAGLAGAAVFSQFPAFSQQYVQRLAGQVDALTEIVVDFDTSALEAGLGREAALQEMTGTPFLDARQSDMRATFARHARLADSLAVLRAATPIERLTQLHRFTDPDVAQAAYADFSPALPLNSAGAVAAGAGGVLGWLLGGALLSLIFLPFRAIQVNLNRLRSTSHTPQRQEPVLRQAARLAPAGGENKIWQRPSSHGAAGTDTNPNKLPGFLTRS